MLLVVIFVPAVIPVIVAGAVFVITPEAMLMSVPALIAPCARAFVKYKFVLPSNKSSVVLLPAIVPAEALRTPESVPNVSPAKVGVLVVCIFCFVSNIYKPLEPVIFKFDDIPIGHTLPAMEESQYKIVFEKLPAGRVKGTTAERDKAFAVSIVFDVELYEILPP